jgi:DNA invertase Pin-like site-specific DNA recombinase
MFFKDIIGLDKVAIYLRKSREDREAEKRGEGETLSKHRMALMEFAVEHRIIIKDKDIFQEIVSGEKIAYRPKMQELLEKVEKKQYKGILCMELDRLSRGEEMDQGYIKEVCIESNTLIITPRKIYDLCREEDKEWSDVQTFFSRMEYSRIKRRLNEGKIGSVKAGRYIGCTPPYGYDKNKDKILILNDDAKIVKMIFNWYVNGDEDGNPMGSTKISDRLTEMGIKSPLLEQHWIPSTVMSILKNEVYIGRLQWKKTYRNLKKHTGYQRDRSEWIDIEGKHECIIDKELFEKAQNIRNGRLIPQVRTKKPRNPFAGLIICGGCGHKMVMQTTTGVKVANVPMEDRLKMIKCTVPVCNTPSSSFRYVEGKLLSGLNDYLNGLVIKEERINSGLENTISSENAYPEMINKLEKELAELEKQKKSIHGAFERGVYDDQTFLERIRDISEYIAKVSKNIKILNVENEKSIINSKAVPETKKIITNVIENYKTTLDVTVKNRLLRSVIDKVIYHRQLGSKKDDFELEIFVKKFADIINA